VDASMSDVLAVGIALPAPYDRLTGTISRTGLMRGWDGVEVAEVMERRLGRPVFVDNAANLAALGELRMGAARGKQNAVVIDAGDGIGAGLIIGGRLYTGHSGIAGELGHTIIREDGPLCRCGNRGCLEAIAGGPAILEPLRAARSGLKLQDVIIHAMSGDSTCIRAIARAGEAIGIATANLCNVFDPERVVVGGELARAGELLLGPLRREVERSIVAGADAAPDIVQDQLGVRASTVGAIAFAVDRVTIQGEEGIA
jgi:predicted NBD/HSP70 family sugar kinase